jgi:hypothetical protein
VGNRLEWVEPQCQLSGTIVEVNRVLVGHADAARGDGSVLFFIAAFRRCMVLPTRRQSDRYHQQLVTCRSGDLQI